MQHPRKVRFGVLVKGQQSHLRAHGFSAIASKAKVTIVDIKEEMLRKHLQPVGHNGTKGLYLGLDF